MEFAVSKIRSSGRNFTKNELHLSYDLFFQSFPEKGTKGEVMDMSCHRDIEP